MGRKKKEVKMADVVESLKQGVENKVASTSPAQQPKESAIPTQKSDKELKKLLSAIGKKYGENCIVTADNVLKIKKIPTSILLLDILLQGGFPQSSINVLYGRFSSGKTTMSLIVAATFTKRQKPVLFIDEEHSFDRVWAEKLGNDLKYLHVCQPDDLEKGIDIADLAVRSRKFSLVIFDSLTAAIPREEIEKEALAQQMALQSRLNSKLVKKLSSGLQPESLEDVNTHNNTIVILTAHLRKKVGISFGSPDIIPGGEAIKHHAHYILKCWPANVLKLKEEPVGVVLKVKVEKAKYSKPYAIGEHDFYFEPPRINNNKTLILYGIKFGLIEQSGTYFRYGEIYEQGKENFIKKLIEQPQELKKLKLALVKGLE